MLNQPGPDKDHKNIIEQGFTLVELLIVIVILGILAGVVIFAIGNLQTSAQAKSCSTEASTVNTAIQAFKTANPQMQIGGGAGAAQEKIMADLTQTANPNGHTATVTNTVGALLQSVPKDYNANGTGFWDWNKGLTYAAGNTNQSWYIDTATQKVVTGGNCT